MTISLRRRGVEGAIDLPPSAKPRPAGLRFEPIAQASPCAPSADTRAATRGALGWWGCGGVPGGEASGAPFSASPPPRGGPRRRWCPPRSEAAIWARPRPLRPPASATQHTPRRPRQAAARGGGGALEPRVRARAPEPVARKASRVRSPLAPMRHSTSTSLQGKGNDPGCTELGSPQVVRVLRDTSARQASRDIRMWHGAVLEAQRVSKLRFRETEKRRACCGQRGVPGAPSRGNDRPTDAPDSRIAH